MKKIIFSGISILSLTITLQAQNQNRLTQYMLQHSFINPAATGKESQLNAAMFYRNQWSGIEGAPVTQGLVLNAPLKDGSHNLGFSAYNDQIGINKHMSFSGSYSFNAKLNDRAKLAFGLSACLDLRQSKLSSANPEDPSDPLFQSDSRMFAMPNFKFGTYYFSEKFYLGIAIPNLLETKIVYNESLKGKTSFNSRDLHFYLHGGYSFVLGSNVDLDVSALLKEASGAPLQVDLSPQLLIKKKLGIGATYRTSNDIAALVNFQISPMFRIGYAYDHSFSKLGRFSNGSHEIMLLFRLKPKGTGSMPSF